MNTHQGRTRFTALHQKRSHQRSCHKTEQGGGKVTTAIWYRINATRRASFHNKKLVPKDGARPKQRSINKETREFNSGALQSIRRRIPNSLVSPSPPLRNLPRRPPVTTSSLFLHLIDSQSQRFIRTRAKHIH